MTETCLQPLSDKFSKNDLLALFRGNDDLSYGVIDVLKDTSRRRVLKISSNKTFITKLSVPRHWKKRLAIKFSRLAPYGYIGLWGEFVFLRFFEERSRILPKPLHYSRLENFKGVQLEYLCQESIEHHRTAEFYLEKKDLNFTVKKICGLFQIMLEEGFCHLDTRPSNILISEESDGFLVDNEYAVPYVTNESLALGFSLGHFYQCRGEVGSYLTREEIICLAEPHLTGSQKSNSFYNAFQTFSTDNISDKLAFDMLCDIQKTKLTYTKVAKNLIGKGI